MTPGASHDEVKTASAQLIEIRLRAPAVEGKANAALIAFLADRLALRARDITIPPECYTGEPPRTRANHGLVAGLTNSAPLPLSRERRRFPVDEKTDH